ncbi:NADH pyrophosphatase [Acholeplasma oculi]|uniref:NUDIX hydrolase n=1 Tax=Acholeplasma oculi TaxID=35623 RepID=A0A061AHW7_9MOLU|nr:NUDIX domain-containing protein [Acholeplasma oculi]CDR31181.1 NUDIX hydrolase [Acholeplasma oculi]SKC37774.1 ADP-ribose pyrophosphatase YjhB, NUDIX family [Acholeplasma oculi]SUT91070.1 NADH pyrophosphatase [Acholeplasma oculi]
MGYIMNLREKVGHDPIIMVSCGAIILKDDSILLQYRRDFKLWAIHGGALEIGETLEETLIREVFEETGLKITDYTYYKVFTGKEFHLTYPNQDQVYLVDHIFKINAFTGKIDEENDEVLNLKWFNIHEIPYEHMLPHNQIILKEFFKNINTSKGE